MCRTTLLVQMLAGTPVTTTVAVACAPAGLLREAAVAWSS
jgi:hypothetical protein